jgi:hypothetical protein
MPGCADCLANTAALATALETVGCDVLCAFDQSDDALRARIFASDADFAGTVGLWDRTQAAPDTSHFVVIDPLGTIRAALQIGLSGPPEAAVLRDIVVRAKGADLAAATTPKPNDSSGCVDWFDFATH